MSALRGLALTLLHGLALLWSACACACAFLLWGNPQSAQRRSHQRRPLPQIRPPQLREACALLGDESRAEIIAETNPAGCAVWHVLNLNGVIPTAEFVSVRTANHLDQLGARS